MCEKVCASSPCDLRALPPGRTEHKRHVSAEGLCRRGQSLSKSVEQGERDSGVEEDDRPRPANSAQQAIKLSERFTTERFLSNGSLSGEKL